VYFANLVGKTSVVKDTLGSRGFTGINVGHDADVPGEVEIP
jgi:hypothetical protein